MFQGDTLIFAAPDPAVVGTGLTADMKLALITEKLPSLEISHRLVSDETFASRLGMTHRTSGLNKILVPTGLLEVPCDTECEMLFELV
jgi:hypothetical protein